MPVRVAFVAAWLLLCGVVAVSAWQTDQLVQANRAAIEQARVSACASAGLVYESISISVKDWPVKDAVAERERASKVLQHWCGVAGQEATG